MPAVLLEQARAARTQADRARRLARDSILPTDVMEKLAAYAAEFEKRALEFEARAVVLAASIAKNRELSAEIHELVEQAKARRARMKGKGPDES